jgi:hypothetical protein
MRGSLLLFFATASFASSYTITVTPWCTNSFRVQVAPAAGDAGLAAPPYRAAAARFAAALAREGLTDIPGALIDECGPGAPVSPVSGAPLTNGNLRATLGADGALTFANAATGAPYLSAAFSLAPSTAYPPYLAAALDATAGDAGERVFGLGQGGWTGEGCIGCPTLPPSTQMVIPLQRNGQWVNLQQRKFHVSIPFVYSTAGYGLLYHMPGYGNVSIGALGTGGSSWRSDAALGLDFWITGLPAGAAPSAAAPIYRQYADATGHAPPLREDAMIFWQSRNRYKSSGIAQAVAANYSALGLPVGILVVDYENQKVDGDFNPNPDCFPSLTNLSAYVRRTLNATTMFSFWPEVKPASSQRATFENAGCLSNNDLGGSVIDTTIESCRDLIWNSFLRPNYFAQGVSSYWLDETDGENIQQNARPRNQRSPPLTPNAQTPNKPRTKNRGGHGRLPAPRLRHELRPRRGLQPVVG